MMGAATVKTETEQSPAEIGIWLLVLADMCIFGLFFWVFAWDKAQLPQQFAAGQATLSTGYGAFNTAALLISSYFIATAVHAVRAGQLVVFRRNLTFTVLCGTAFIIVKCIEYGEKFAAGFHIASNAFYRDYFAFTGIHMLHVMIGLGLLSYLLFSTRSQSQLQSDQPLIEGSALYWHMVDLIWVVLFSLIYLVP